MAVSSETKDIQVPEELNDQTWELLAPQFQDDQQLPRNWYDVVNQDGKSLLVLAAENARCKEIDTFLRLIRRDGNNVKPGGRTTSNIVWIAIGGVGAPGGGTFMECLLHYPKFVCQHAFAVMEDEREQSPIHLAAIRGIINLFKTLEGYDKAGLIERLKKCVDRDGETPLDLAIHTGNLDMIKLLINLYTLPTSMDTAVPRLKKENILHRALKSKTPDLAVVQTILRKSSSFLTEPNREGKTPLQYLAGKQDVNLRRVASDKSKEAVQSAKDFLIGCLFESEELNYGGLRRELGDEALGKELYFDISFMSQPKQSFKRYLDNLKNLDIEFSSTLKAVNLPDLQCSEYSGIDSDITGPGIAPSNKCGRKYGVRSTYEAVDVFNFLRVEREVRCVKSVKVPDCIVHPHPNLKIRECLRDLDIRSLHWRKRDLSLSLVKEVAPNVAELHLYSSGNEDVLRFWSQTGLSELPEVKKLTISISRCEFDPDSNQDPESFRAKWQAAFQGKVPECSVLMEPAEKVRMPGVIGIHRTLSNSGRGRTMFTEMEPFTNFMKAVSSNEDLIQTQNARENPIKVAILDTGLSLFDLPGMLHPPIGRSFVEDSESSSDTHWHSPQCSHGNKLAQLILRCNPHCQLYIGKVQSGPDATSVEISAAIKALEWVAEEKVDIVCMSWTMNESKMEKEKRYQFEDAIEKAGALTFCALSDEGRLHNTGTSYPAGFKKSFKISSYSPTHRGSNDSEHHPEAFYFPADDIAIDDIPKYFSDSKKGTEEVLFKGSSYATALAAGTAAFVLQCVQYAFHPGTLPTQNMTQPLEVSNMITDYKRLKMERMFTSMCRFEPGETKYFVKPSNAFMDHDWSLASENDTQRLAALKTLLEKN